MPERIYIFDLDGTIIDSDHRYRQCCREDGSLDVDKYLAQKGKLIHKDKPLPLARYAQRKYDQGETVLWCTSRTIHGPDLDFFKQHKMRATKILGRPEGCRDIDWKLKSDLLGFLRRPEFDDVQKVFFDDLQPNLDVVADINLMTTVKV